MNNLKKGSIVKSPIWPEPVEIKYYYGETDDYINILGETTISHEPIDQLILKKNLKILKKLNQT